MQRGLVIYDNFTGCIENLYLNHTNVIAAFKTPFLYKVRIQHYSRVFRKIALLKNQELDQTYSDQILLDLFLHDFVSKQ